MRFFSAMGAKLVFTIGLALTLAIGMPGLRAVWGSGPLSPEAAVSPVVLPAISAEMVIVLDDATRQVLYAKSPHKRVASASLTKMVTALVALERGDLADRVKVDIDSERLVAETESSVMGLMPGDELTLEQLLYGLLLPSGNDAAIVIARHIAGSESRFVELMNRKVKEMGLKDTRFANSHGLDAEGHYSTAYNMAVIARSAMRNPTIAKIVATKRTKVRLSEGKEVELFNGNPLIGWYRGADGVKPGYTDEAQQAIAATAKRGNRRLYVVIIRSNNITEDSANLFDYYFALPILISLRTTALMPLEVAGR